MADMRDDTIEVIAWKTMRVARDPHSPHGWLWLSDDNELVPILADNAAWSVVLASLDEELGPTPQTPIRTVAFSGGVFVERPDGLWAHRDEPGKAVKPSRELFAEALVYASELEAALEDSTISTGHPLAAVGFDRRVTHGNVQYWVDRIDQTPDSRTTPTPPGVSSRRGWWVGVGTERIPLEETSQEHALLDALYPQARHTITTD